MKKPTKTKKLVKKLRARRLATVCLENYKITKDGRCIKIKTTVLGNKGIPIAPPPPLVKSLQEIKLKKDLQSEINSYLKSKEILERQKSAENKEKIARQLSSDLNKIARQKSAEAKETLARQKSAEAKETLARQKSAEAKETLARQKSAEAKETLARQKSAEAKETLARQKSAEAKETLARQKSAEAKETLARQKSAEAKETLRQKSAEAKETLARQKSAEAKENIVKKRNKLLNLVKGKFFVDYENCSTFEEKYTRDCEKLYGADNSNTNNCKNKRLLDAYSYVPLKILLKEDKCPNLL